MLALPFLLSPPGHHHHSLHVKVSVPTSTLTAISSCVTAANRRSSWPSAKTVQTKDACSTNAVAGHAGFFCGPTSRVRKGHRRVWVHLRSLRGPLKGSHTTQEMRDRPCVTVSRQQWRARCRRTVPTKAERSTHAGNPENSSVASSSGLMRTLLRQVRLSTNVLM